MPHETALFTSSRASQCMWNRKVAVKNSNARRMVWIVRHDVFERAFDIPAVMENFARYLALFIFIWRNGNYIYLEALFTTSIPWFHRRQTYFFAGTPKLIKSTSFNLYFLVYRCTAGWKLVEWMIKCVHWCISSLARYNNTYHDRLDQCMSVALEDASYAIGAWE